MTVIRVTTAATALDDLCFIDEAAAVSVAVSWLNDETSSPDMVSAARTIAQHQKLVPNCPGCGVPLLLEKSHPSCDAEHMRQLLSSFCGTPGCYELATSYYHECPEHDGGYLRLRDEEEMALGEYNAGRDQGMEY